MRRRPLLPPITLWVSTSLYVVTWYWFRSRSSPDPWSQLWSDGRGARDRVTSNSMEERGEKPKLGGRGIYWMTTCRPCFNLSSWIGLLRFRASLVVGCIITSRSVKLPVTELWMVDLSSQITRLDYLHPGRQTISTPALEATAGSPHRFLCKYSSSMCIYIYR